MANAHALSPTDPRWIYYAAHLHRIAGRVPEAVEGYRAYLELDPESVAARMRLAELDLEQGKVEEPRAEIESIVAANPDLAYGHMLLAEFATEAGDFAKAVEHYEIVRRLQPEATVVNYALALAYQRVGEGEKGEALLADRGEMKVRLDEPLVDELDQIQTGASYQLLRYGTQYIEQGEFATAVQVLERASQERPDDAEVFFRLGQARGGVEDAQGAIVALERAMFLDPDHPGAPFLLAQVLMGTGQPERGEALAIDSVERHPGDTNLLTLAATIKRHKGDCKAALVYYDQLLTLLPAEGTLRIEQVLCRAEQGDLVGALEAVESGLSAAPGEPGLVDALARLLSVLPPAEGGDPARALESADAGMALARGLEQLETLAMARAASGDFEAAIEAQEEALEIARANKDASPLGPAYVSRLERMLERYRTDLPADEPWPAFMLRPGEE
jgi:tetratricopeptide (TPR) repeat protein